MHVVLKLLCRYVCFKAILYNVLVLRLVSSFGIRFVSYLIGKNTRETINITKTLWESFL